MSPQPLTAIRGAGAFHRLLVIGPPKIGKTHWSLKTAHKPVYVLACDGGQSLKPGLRECADGEVFFDDVNGQDRVLLNQIEVAVIEASKGARDGRYKTIVVDTLSTLSKNLSEIFVPPDCVNVRAGWGAYGMKLRGIIQRLNTLPAHIVYLCHDKIVMDEKGVKKEILPYIQGKTAGDISALVDDIVYLEREGDARVFRTSITGVLGPGCRNLPGVRTIPADLTAMWQTINLESQTKH